MKEKPVADQGQEICETPVPDVPDLKKKDKERKRAGAAWGGGPVGTPFAGAPGGSGSAGIEAVAGAAGAAGTAGAAAAVPTGMSRLGDACARFLSKAVSETDSASPEAPVPSIPDLKKLDKERKRAGAAWGGGRAVGAPFAGATGGSGAAGIEAVVGGGRAAAAAAQGAAGAAQAAAGAAGAAGSTAAVPAGLGWLGGASASFLSKAMIGIGVASLLAGIGLYAYLRLHEKPALSQGAGLGPIHDPIKVRRGASDERLKMAAQAGHGQFQFDPAPAAETAAAAPEAKDAQPSEKPADNPWGDILSAVQGPHGFAAGNLAGLPSGSDGSFAGHDIYSSLTGAKGRGSLGNTPSLRYPAQKGKLSALARGATRSSRASAMRTRNIRSGRAFAQLRYARGMSLQAARGSSSEQGMKITALQAFDQNDTQGGQIAQIDAPVPVDAAGATHGEYGGGTVPLLSDPNALPDEPTTPNAVVDPGEKQKYQDPMDAIKQLAALAGKLKLLSIILIAAGIALIAAGCACTPVGWGLIAAGVALVAIGIYMLMMANQMGAQAKAMAAQLEAAYGQEYQQKDVDACVQQAIAQGLKDPDKECHAPYDPSNLGNRKTSVEQDVNAERGSNWEYDDGQPASQR